MILRQGQTVNKQHERQKYRMSKKEMTYFLLYTVSGVPMSNRTLLPVIRFSEQSFNSKLTAVKVKWLFADLETDGLTYIVVYKNSCAAKKRNDPIVTLL